MILNNRLLLVGAALIGLTSGHVLGALVAVFVIKFLVLPLLFPAPPAPAPKATATKKPAAKSKATTTKSTTRKPKAKTT